MNAQWLLTETLAMLQHLQARGAVRRLERSAGEPERWVSNWSR